MLLSRKQRAKRRRGVFTCLTFRNGEVWLMVAYVCAYAWLMGLLHQTREQQQLEESTTEKHYVQNDQLKSDASKTENINPSVAAEKKKGLTQTDRPPISRYMDDIHAAERALAQLGPKSFRRILTAYTEAPMKDTTPNTGSRGDLGKEADTGTAPDFVVPLPLRTQTPDDLLVWKYPAVQTCRDLPGKLPVDRGLQVDGSGNAVVWNVGNDPNPANFPLQEAPYCPVELDPFLPWIHDVFYAQGKVHFIAHNKRRCRTGSKYTAEVNRLVPQVTLMQPVSVQILDASKARALAPTLWYPENDVGTSPRYRLVPFDEADVNSTRFICRFHATQVSDNMPESRFAGETLSEFPFNPEFVGYRKLHDTLLTPKGKDTNFYWATSILFSCPLPSWLQSAPVLSDGTPLLYVDVIPIRTSARYREVHLPAFMIGPQPEVPVFDAARRWGPANVLPHVLASGRWENIPVCPLPEGKDESKETLSNPNQARGDSERQGDSQQSPKKPYFLSACLWASAEFKTRGVTRGATADTAARLIEWIHFHLLVGFDHVYLYDNSGAHTNKTSLAFAAAMFPGKVTHIDWPHVVCNNNVPAHDSTGERSSQYAAENSCRTRYASSTEWIASFDTDEYLIPMGNYTNLKDMLRDASRGGTQILSLKSSRGYLRPEKCKSVESGLIKEENATFLEAYNCDSAPSPKPGWANRARKQIYRADYVLYHFVHFATVTQGMLEPFEKNKTHWRRKYVAEQAPIERTTDELHEAVMVHAKTTAFEMTINYVQNCREKREKKWKSCFIAHPWPLESTTTADHDDALGMPYNCYINQQVEDYWVPKLKQRLGLPS